MPNKPRGENLDEKLRRELNKMLEEGYALSPISRSALQKKLGLNSRSTLTIKSRADLIENAKTVQLHNAGLDATGKKRRNTLEEQNNSLKLEIDALKKDRDILVEKIAMIISGIQAKGYDLEELMRPLRI